MNTDASGSEAALVLFSGGQDSSTCLAWALNRFARVHTVGFTYGQRHMVEMDCRREILARLPLLRPHWRTALGGDHVLDLAVLGLLAESSLTRDIPISCPAGSLPNTFVPGRNLMFLITAAALAWRLGCRHLIAGMCETDSSGYPDCRDDAIKAMQLALNLGMDTRLVVHTPLMWLDKARTWELAGQEGGEELVELVRVGTHTCYLGERGSLHAWGYGCGACPACLLRAAGWRIYAASSGRPPLKPL
jgi:7-cyano-7-deazaguanine synthase